MHSWQMNGKFGKKKEERLRMLNINVDFMDMQPKLFYGYAVTLKF